MYHIKLSNSDLLQRECDKVHFTLKDSLSLYLRLTSHSKLHIVDPVQPPTITAGPVGQTRLGGLII